MARGSRTPAEAAFRRALDEVDEETAPFDRALALASYGAFLRRTGKRTAAAAHLEAARAGFARLGARPSLERCERELASIGLAPRRRRPDERLSLTPREQSVVRLVAQGKRNREVATELFVSVNTVEYHLKNIYIKLGVASRSQLILALGRSASGSTAAPGPPEAGRRGLGVKPARSGPGT